jgi:hypothetical protein
MSLPLWNAKGSGNVKPVGDMVHLGLMSGPETIGGLKFGMSAQGDEAVISAVGLYNRLSEEGKGVLTPFPSSGRFSVGPGWKEKIFSVSLGRVRTILNLFAELLLIGTPRKNPPLTFSSKT